MQRRTKLTLDYFFRIYEIIGHNYSLLGSTHLVQAVFDNKAFHVILY